MSLTESDIRRIFREELELVLERVLNQRQQDGATNMERVMRSSPRSTGATPTLDMVKSMSRSEQLDAFARDPELAKLWFKYNNPPRKRKAA